MQDPILLVSIATYTRMQGSCKELFSLKKHDFINSIVLNVFKNCDVTVTDIQYYRHKCHKQEVILLNLIRLELYIGTGGTHQSQMGITGVMRIRGLLLTIEIWQIDLLITLAVSDNPCSTFLLKTSEWMNFIYFFE